MSVEPGRICAPDVATKRRIWDQMIASKQTVSAYTVHMLDGDVVGMRLTQAQAEGYECLTCKTQCGQGSEAFRPVGNIPNVSRVFCCVACLDGVR